MKVTLHLMGTYPGRLQLDKVADTLNGLYGGLCQFDSENGKNVESLGDPDIGGRYYSVALFVEKLGRQPMHDQVELIFTEVPIEQNFFAKTYKTLSVITTHQASLALQGTEFSVFHYLVLKSIQEVFWIVCKLYSDQPDVSPRESQGGLFHYDRLGCLFNFSVHKLEEQVQKLRASTICSLCRERAIEHFGVPPEFLTATLQALRDFTKPDFGRSFSRIMNEPWLNFACGVVLGGLLTNIVASLLISFSDTWIWQASLSLVLFLLGIGILFIAHRVHIREHKRELEHMVNSED